jgi:hypothetical protein
MSQLRPLFVEGNDDVHVVANLCKFYGISVTMPRKSPLESDVFEIVDKGGISNLLETLPTEIKVRSQGDVLGMVVDADLDLLARWNSIKDILTQKGYKVPKKPALEGTILRNDDLPTVGIWLMPDNHLRGMLEDFVAKLVPENDILWNYALESVQSLPEKRF